MRRITLLWQRLFLLLTCCLVGNAEIGGGDDALLQENHEKVRAWIGILYNVIETGHHVLHVFVLLIVQPITERGDSDTAAAAAAAESSSLIDHDDEHRRMRMIVDYWTREKMERALPAEARVSSRQPKKKPTRRGSSGDSVVLAQNGQDNNEYLIWVEDFQLLECAVQYKELDDDEERTKRRNLRQSRYIGAPPLITQQYHRVVEGTAFVDFVVDVRNVQKQSAKIYFYLNTRESVFNVAFDISKGEGRYTYTLGPFPSGVDYQWKFRTKKARRYNRRQWPTFSVTNGVAATTTTWTQDGRKPFPSWLDYFYASEEETTNENDRVITLEWKIAKDVGVRRIFCVTTSNERKFEYQERDLTSSRSDSMQFSVRKAKGFTMTLWVQNEDGSLGRANPITVDPTTITTPVNDDGTCPTPLDHYRDRSQILHKAVGRLLFVRNDKEYFCTGTLVESASDRYLISTAAHCVYDRSSDSFGKKFLFIPGQDDGGTDGSDRACGNDMRGCYYPKWGVISEEYETSSSGNRFNFDYAFLVVPRMAPLGGLDNTDTNMMQLGISFREMEYEENAFVFGYPKDRDPDFMFSHGRLERDTMGYYIDCSLIRGGSSGGPWAQPDPARGNQIVVSSVISWIWENNSPGVGGPPFHTGGAECVYNFANTLSIEPGTPRKRRYVKAPCFSPYNNE